MSDRLDWEREGRDWPNRDASRFVVAGGLRWHVQVMGQGPLVLMVHGTGASTHSWRDFAPLLARHFTIVAPDLPGHGFTQAPASGRLSLPGMAQSLQHLLNEMQLRPTFAIGHSAGAAIAIRMCQDGLMQPQGLASLNGALLPYGGSIAEFLSPVAKMLAANPFVPRFFAWQAREPATLDRLLRNTGSKIDARGAELYGRLIRNPGHVAAALAMMAGWDLAGLKRELPRVKVPVLLVAGGQDRMIPADQAFAVRKLLQNAKLAYLRQHGHLAHEQAPDVIAALVVQFFGDVQMSAQRCVA